MTRAVVIGAHGRTGAAVVNELVHAGISVVGTVRNPVHVQDLRCEGAEGRLVDLLTASTDDLRHVMVGADAVAYAAGSGWGDRRETVSQLDGQAIMRAVDAAVSVGADRFVLLSAHRADEDLGDDHIDHLLRAKRRADAYLRGSRLGWTILRPDTLTEEPPTGCIQLAPHVPHGAIPRSDFAHLICRAIQTSFATHQRLEVIGGLTPIDEALRTLRQD